MQLIPMGKRPLDVRSHQFWSSRRDHKALAAMLDQVWRRRVSRAENREARGQRFQQHLREAFGDRRKHEQIRLAVSLL